MTERPPAFSVEALRRKLRAVTGLLRDRAATDSEKANAEALKARLEGQLKDAGAPAGDWSDTAFRLGRKVGEISRTAAPPVAKGDWTDNVFRAGRVLGRSLKKWRAP